MTYESGMAVRRARSDEAEAIAQLAARTFRATYQATADPVELEAHIASHLSMPAVAAELADPGAVTLLLEQRGGLVGYALLRSGPAPECVRGAAPVELGRIYLESDALGRGLGQALLRACRDEAARMGRETLWLGVWEDNERALSFYERHGFRRVGSCPFEFGGVMQQDIVMESSVAGVSDDRGTIR